MGKVVLAGGIYSVQSGPGNGYGYASRVQGSGMAGPIYANSKPAGYAETGCRQVICEVPGSLASGHAGIAGTNHGQLGGAKHFRVAVYKEQRWRIGDLSQQVRVVWVLQSDQVIVGLFRPAQINLDRRPVRVTQIPFQIFFESPGRKP